MHSIKRGPLLFLGLALAMMILGACSWGSTTNSLSLLKVLQNSANAMKNVQTSHVDLNVASQISGANATGFETPGNIDVTLQGSGDQSIPDNLEKMDLTLGFDSFPVQVSEVITSTKIYIQPPQDQWYSFDKTTLEQSACDLTSFLSVPTIDLNSLLVLIEHITITDHGDENLNGQSLRHMTANMDKTALTQLVLDNPKLKCEIGSQDFNTVNTFSASVDMYIDEKQFYVHRAKLQVSLGMNNNGKTTSTTSDLTIDLSNFNLPVTITAPANATPLTDPKQLLGKLSGLLQ